MSIIDTLSIIGIVAGFLFAMYMLVSMIVYRSSEKEEKKYERLFFVGIATMIISGILLSI